MSNSIIYHILSKLHFETVISLFVGGTLICFSSQASATNYTNTVNGSIPARVLQGGDTVTVNGNGVRALYANGSGQSIIVQNGGVTLTNLSFPGGYGIVSAISGGLIDLGIGSIVNVEGSGVGSYMGPTGFFVNGVGSVGKAQNLIVNASGDKPYGVHTRAGGTINLTGVTTINLAANIISENAFGLVAGWSTPTSESTITVENLIVTSTGYNGSLGYITGILSNNNTAITISGLTKLDLEGKWAEGVSTGSANGDFGTISVNNIDATMEASDGGAGLAMGFSSHYGVVSVLGNTRFDISSDGEGVGIYLDEQGNVDLTGTSLFSISAPSAYGIRAEATFGTVTANNIVMNVTGTTDAALISAMASTANDSNDVTINNGSLNSNMDGISVEGGTLNISLTGTTMTNGSGIAFKVGPDAANTYRGDLELTASNSVFSGAARLVPGSISNIMLDDRSSWTITGDSVLTSLTNNNSVVAFSFPSGEAFKTLTVNNYSGVGGILTLNTMLGGDTSPSDLLVINGGTATGSTLLSIVNAGGLGGQTVEGIQIIDVSGTSTGSAFVQGGRIVAGAYEYSLMKGNVSGLDPESWYLTSQYIITDQGGNKTQTGVYMMRPEGGTYSANLAAANNMFNMRLHDRLGEPQFADSLSAQDKVSSLWIRYDYGHNRSEDSSGQLTNKSDRSVVQVGGDIAQWSSNGSDRFHLGVMGGYGRVNIDTDSSLTGYRSSGKVDGYSLGVYGTWYANQEDKSGLYVDGWILWNDVNAKVNGSGLAEESYDIKGVTASLEAGYSFQIGQMNEEYGVWIQPQAQVTWMGAKADDHMEHNGTWVTSNRNNVQTRLGARGYLSNINSQASQNVVQPYLELNWIHNTKSYHVNMGGTEISQDGAKDVGEVRIGMEANISRNTTLWFNVGHQMGSNSYRDTAAQFGLKYSF